MGDGRYIAITGGKGGTGKTTVALHIAKKYLSKNKRVLLIDADIECPNIHQFIELGEKEGELYIEYPHINEELCIMCHACIERCPNNALFSTGGVPKLIESMCDGCTVCKHICPTKAIEMKKHSVGNIFVNKGNPGLITGILNKNVEETGEFIDQLIEISKNMNYDIKIIDTAAGTHCNVIRAIEPADSIVIVTEPTPLGYHDFNIMIELIEKMGKLEISSVVINKAGISKDIEGKIEEKARSKGIERIEYLPYSENIAKSYAKGELYGQI